VYSDSVNLFIEKQVFLYISTKIKQMTKTWETQLMHTLGQKYLSNSVIKLTVICLRY